MFLCAEGHSSQPGEKRTLIPVIIRNVYTFHTGGKQKGVIEGKGFEIVQEWAFCPEHVKRFTPIVLPVEVERNHKIQQQTVPKTEKKKKFFDND